jgi:manganese efflux pump family protein
VGVLVLCAWLLTAGLGGYLASVWIRHGGLRQRMPGVTRLPLWLVMGHVLLALAGLASWTAYVAGGVRSTAWASCAVVLVVATFGFMMLLRWMPSAGRHSHGGRTAERHFPLTAVVAHGMCAGATVLLVVLVVLRRV